MSVLLRYCLIIKFLDGSHTRGVSSLRYSTQLHAAANGVACTPFCAAIFTRLMNSWGTVAPPGPLFSSTRLSIAKFQIKHSFTPCIHYPQRVIRNIIFSQVSLFRKYKSILLRCNGSEHRVVNLLQKKRIKADMQFLTGVADCRIKQAI